MTTAHPPSVADPHSELLPAPMALRVIAYLLDGTTVLLSVGLGLISLWANVVSFGPALNPALALDPIPVVTWVWLVWFFLCIGTWMYLAQRGQTIGKAIVGLKIVRLDLPAHPPLGIGRMFLRSLVQRFLHSTGILLLIDLYLLLTDEKQRRSATDRLLDCQVVRI